MRRTLDSVAAQTRAPRAVGRGRRRLDRRDAGDPGGVRAEAARTCGSCAGADRGRRSVGPGVIEAFYAGLETVDLDDFDYLCKLDLDLELPPRYFELLIARMEADPRLGTTSRQALLHPRARRRARPRGVRRRDVGRHDEVLPHGVLPRDRRLRARGDVGRHRLPPLPHARLDRGERRRPRACASCTCGRWARARRASGPAACARASASTSWAPRPLYLLASAAFRLFKHPVLYGSVAMLWGYSRAPRAAAPRYDDPAFRRFLRRYQRECLLHGKREATRRRERGAGAASGARRTHEPAQAEDAPGSTAGVSCWAVRSTA